MPEYVVNEYNEITTKSGLEEIKTLKSMLIGNGCNTSINNYVEQLSQPIEQIIEAFDIIKNKKVNVDELIHSHTLDEYNEYAFRYIDAKCMLTQEEFNLLMRLLLARTKKCEVEDNE